jgi:hypothetical protein|tara:strand:- start:2679 stop:3155 length:477 start_codon:yes stop_codon:yes gene_type:complete
MNNMKKFKILFLLLFLTNLLNAQKNEIRSEKIDAYKKIYLTDKLNLNSENESKFWVVYNNYQDSLRVVYRTKRLKYRKMNLDSSNISDLEHEQFIDDFLDYEKKKIDLRAKLISDLKEFMTLKKTVYLFRIEDDFRKEMMKKIISSKEGKIKIKSENN